MLHSYREINTTRNISSHQMLKGLQTRVSRGTRIHTRQHMWIWAPWQFYFLRPILQVHAWCIFGQKQQVKARHIMWKCALYIMSYVKLERYLQIPIFVWLCGFFRQHSLDCLLLDWTRLQCGQQRTKSLFWNFPKIHRSLSNFEQLQT